MPEDIRDLWRKQQTESVTITLDDVRGRARKFESRVRSRNVREYLAGAVVIPFFIAAALRNHGWRTVPPLLLVAGVLVVLYELHRRASAPKADSDAGLQSSIESYIRDLERQRAALESVWLWYELPFAPGLVAAIVASAMDRGAGRTIVSGVSFVAVFGGIWALNARGARRLAKQIGELRKISSAGEENG